MRACIQLSTHRYLSTFNEESLGIHDSDYVAEKTAGSNTVGTYHSHSTGGFGVFREDEEKDIEALVNNFTTPALAKALRERESTLQIAALLAEQGKLTELQELLDPFLRSNVERRRRKRHTIDLSKESGFTRRELVVLQRYLHKMPRQLFKAVDRRASVVIPLCNVNGVASVLFQKRSDKVRTHKQQVCFPGGMVEEGVDETIIQTSLREMQEEIGVSPEEVEVLGILRCDWSEVASMTGIAVTPVVGFIGDLNDLTLTPNPDEVEQLFTIPMEELLDNKNWAKYDFAPPVYNGDPHVIWGLTAYLLSRFLNDVVRKCQISI